jgi:SAM-dependent methyltransferase
MALCAPDTSVLACPGCRRELAVAGGAGDGLRCVGCGSVYAVEDGIVDLMPRGSSDTAAGRRVRRWRKRLDRLTSWRRATWDGSTAAAGRQRFADDLAQAFFRFARLPNGRVLEIGCGDGGFRRFIAPAAYWGVDPLPQPPAGNGDATILRAVGERLPLADRSFDAVLLCETLDHTIEPRRVIEEAHRVLSDGGVLAVMQNVRDEHAPPLHRRLRARLGALKARALGVRTIDAAATKTHRFAAADLDGLFDGIFAIGDRDARGAVVFLRGVKRPWAGSAS